MALAPWAMHTRSPQSWWLTASHVSKATAKMAGRWDYFNPKKSLLCCDWESHSWLFWSTDLVHAWSLCLTDSYFQFAIPSDFCCQTFPQLDSSFAFPVSNLGPFWFTYWFHFSPVTLQFSSLIFLVGQSRVWVLIGPFTLCENGLDQGWWGREGKRENGKKQVGGLTVSTSVVLICVCTCIDVCTSDR